MLLVDMDPHRWKAPLFRGRWLLHLLLLPLPRRFEPFAPDERLRTVGSSEMPWPRRVGVAPAALGSLHVAEPLGRGEREHLLALHQLLAGLHAAQTLVETMVKPR